jgi:HNH endonuclease
MKTHQVAWILTNGKVPVGLNVLHYCDNPPCGKIEHLWLGTQAENMADAARKGRMKKGKQKIRLTEVQVLEIRRLKSDGWTHRKLADKYGVGTNTIRRIVQGHVWKHLLQPSQDTELDTP